MGRIFLRCHILLLKFSIFEPLETTSKKMEIAGARCDLLSF